MAVLLGVGSLAVHQLRFLLWYGQSSDDALSSQGHAYLAVVGPVVVAATVLAFARVLNRLARGGRAGSPRLIPLWAGMAASLLFMYVFQESLEGALASGHPGGPAGVLGHGGWLALPLSAAVGLALALALRGAAHAPGLLPRNGPGTPRQIAEPSALHTLLPVLAPRQSPRAPFAARAPPAASA